MISVKEKKQILDKIGKILDIYENHSFIEMLDDIISKVAPNKETKQLNRKKQKPYIDFNVIQHKIEKINNQQEIIQELIKLDKNALIDFGKFVGVGVEKREDKLSIAQVIASHLNLPRLNEKISQRYKATGFSRE